jgi:pilus assembly protein Flp/PilA
MQGYPVMIKFLRDESGATAIEYGLIAALIAVALISGAASLGESISNLFGGTNSDIAKVFNN